MIQITPHMRILVAVAPADFRRGIDGLARLVKAELAADPFSGFLFVFRNRRATAVKVLVYDGQGFWLCQKRLSAARFRYWPGGDEPSAALAPHELAVLLSAGNFAAAPGAPPWRRLEWARESPCVPNSDRVQHRSAWMSSSPTAGGPSPRSTSSRFAR